MDGWTFLAWGVVCGAGMLIFLRVVAAEVERATREIKRTELIVRRALDRQRGLGSAEIVSSQAA